MTRINLLPPEIKEKVRRPSVFPSIIILGIIVLAVIVGGWFFYNNQKKSKQTTLDQKTQELNALKTANAPIAEFEKQQQQLKAIKSIYDQANKGRVAWALILNNLAKYVPEDLTTASNPEAPTIWLSELSIDATPLETGAAALQGNTAPIVIKGHAAPAWLCIQTWLPRSQDFQDRGFLDAFPYYYYFRGQPKVAEFLVRLMNMQQWSNIWIASSQEEATTDTINVSVDPATGQMTEQALPTWMLTFEIDAFWNVNQAIYKPADTPSTQGAAAGQTGGK